MLAVLHKLLVSVVLLGGAALSLAATTAFADDDGNARCRLRMQYRDNVPGEPFGGKDTPWIPNTEECTGMCGEIACAWEDSDDADNVKVLRCQCPGSGGGTHGCHAVSRYERISPTDPWVFKGVTCVGEGACETNQICHYLNLGSIGGNYFGTCACQ